MELKGILKQIHPTVTRGNYDSRKLWITTDQDSKYPQTIEVEVSGKNTNLFNQIAIGTLVTCSINLRGREWTGNDGVTKVFNTIQVWKVSVAIDAGGYYPQPVSNSPTYSNGFVPQPAQVEDDINNDPNDLPF